MPEEAGREDPARGRWIPLVYYYLAATVGLAITLVGIVGMLNGAVVAVLPKLSSEVRYLETAPPRDPSGAPADNLSAAERERIRDDSIERARLGGIERTVRGGVTALVGAPVFVWHLTQARRREPLGVRQAGRPSGGT